MRTIVMLTAISFAFVFILSFVRVGYYNSRNNYQEEKDITITMIPFKDTIEELRSGIADPEHYIMRDLTKVLLFTVIAMVDMYLLSKLGLSKRRIEMAFIGISLLTVFFVELIPFVINKHAYLGIDNILFYLLGVFMGFLLYKAACYVRAIGIAQRSMNA